MPISQESSRQQHNSKVIFNIKCENTGIRVPHVTLTSRLSNIIIIIKIHNVFK